MLRMFALIVLVACAGCQSDGETVASLFTGPGAGTEGAETTAGAGAVTWGATGGSGVGRLVPPNAVGLDALDPGRRQLVRGHYIREIDEDRQRIRQGITRVALSLDVQAVPVDEIAGDDLLVRLRSPALCDDAGRCPIDLLLVRDGRLQERLSLTAHGAAILETEVAGMRDVVVATPATLWRWDPSQGRYARVGLVDSCDDFVSQAAAQSFLEARMTPGLDPDGNGVACDAV